MKPSIAHFADFSPDSRIWVYIADRKLSPSEASIIQAELDAFVLQWTAHHQALKASAEVFADRIVFLMVDETGAGASGCSIDKSVHFLEDLGRRSGIDFFNRLQYAWISNGEVRVDSAAAFADACSAGTVTNDTVVLNTLIQSKSDFDQKWELPFSRSWHRRLV